MNVDSVAQNLVRDYIGAVEKIKEGEDSKETLKLHILSVYKNFADFLDDQDGLWRPAFEKVMLQKNGFFSNFKTNEEKTAIKKKVTKDLTGNFKNFKSFIQRAFMKAKPDQVRGDNPVQTRSMSEVEIIIVPPPKIIVIDLVNDDFEEAPVAKKPRRNEVEIIEVSDDDDDDDDE